MDLKVHSDWATPGFDLPPVAPAVGPFPRRAFLHALTTILEERSVSLVEGDGVLIPLTIDGKTLAFAGDADLTDYRSPLGTEVPGAIAALVEDLEPGVHIDFDSLPLEAVEPLAEGLRAAGIDPVVEQHTVAAVLDLPGHFEDYLAGIGKKQRHEVRRKRRRYEEEVGALVHETHRGAGWGFEEFVRLHRLSPGAKGDFMSPDREAFFAALVETDGWRVDLLRVPDAERAAAALFSFTDEEAFYLYNSAYDPALSDASPGVAIVGSMIEQAIAEGIRRFDFLKGDEVYKFRLGARERPLFRVTATR